VRDMRKDMLRGQHPDQCIKCKNNPSFKNFVNKKILDSELLEYIGSTDSDGFIDTDKFKLKYHDFRFSNVCNFGCRMCHGGNSSFLLHEENKNKGIVIKPSITSDIWDAISFIHLKDCKAISFAGGEPMLMKEHWLTLDKLLIENNTDVELVYNINASTLSYAGKHVFDYWKKFKSVDVNCSIDDICERAEYQRYGTKWDDVMRNLHDINKFFGFLKIHSTVTVYNIMYIDQMIDYLKKQHLNVEISFELCYTPVWLNPTLLPDKYKQQVVSQLSSISSNHSVKIHGLQNIIKVLSDKSSNFADRMKFIERTAYFDKIRNQRLADFMPEVYEMTQSPEFKNE
jgi:sulfatase maturation enzyme AslB (radical SAM superfamily)